MGFKELERRIKENAQKYYQDGSQELSDEEFDSLVDELKSKDPDSELLKVGWGYDPIKDTTPGSKVQHRYGVVGSLAKVHNWNELDKTLSYNLVIASLKLDGISVVLYYENGVMTQAITRGNGYVGVDITEKCNYILTKKYGRRHVIDKKFTGAIRGEILMSYSSFESYSSIHEGSKNPRNTTAGIINSKEFEYEDLDYLDIYVYKIVGIEMVMDRTSSCSSDIKTYNDVLSFLCKNFEKVVPHTSVILEENTFDNCMNSLRSEWYGVVPADGIVIADNRLIEIPIELRKIAIEYSSQAYKFEAETKLAKVEEVEWSMSKTGYMIPRVRIEPTQLSGTTVRYASGFNAAFIKDNNIGPGAIIKVEKANEIIPDIQTIEEPSSKCYVPKLCPCCGSTLQWVGVNIACTNLSCQGAKMQDLLVWSTTLAPVDGLGTLILQKFYNNYYGQEADVDHVMNSDFPTDLSRLLSGDLGANAKLFGQCIQILKSPSSKFKLSDELKALNVPRIGDKTSEKLAHYPELVREILDVSRGDKDVSCLEKYINIIGDANFDSIIKNLHRFKRLSYVIDRTESISDTSAKTKGKVAITGKLSCKRSVFEEQLKSAGYVPSAISKDTLFLITDDPDSNSDKNKKADKWGITKISEADFRNNYM